MANKKMTAKDKTIAIIEDDDILRSTLSDALADEGFAVITANDGEAGLRLVLNKHPDLILLDIVMPLMDGLTMLKKLRADQWGGGVPVIVLTNLSDAVTIAEITEQTAYDYLVKSSWQLEAVVKKVKEKLGVA